MTDTLRIDLPIRRALRPELALAWASLVLFAIAVLMTFWATEHFLDAKYGYDTDGGEGFDGLIYLFYEIVLAPAAVVHLLSVLLATYRAVLARPEGGAGRVVVWIAYVVGVLSVAVACASGIDDVSSSFAPQHLKDQATVLLVAPLVVVALAGAVPFVWSRYAARSR